MDEPKWVATFEGGVTVLVWDDVWAVLGDDPEACEEVSVRVTEAAATGWPGLAGLTVDRSPGWDAEWTYLRLTALGAEVVGPWPQESLVEMEYPADAIIG